jgi:hypothetical protein
MVAADILKKPEECVMLLVDFQAVVSSWRMAGDMAWDSHMPGR